MATHENSSELISLIPVLSNMVQRLTYGRMFSFMLFFCDIFQWCFLVRASGFRLLKIMKIEKVFYCIITWRTHIRIGHILASFERFFCQRNQNFSIFFWFRPKRGNISKENEHYHEHLVKIPVSFRIQCLHSNVPMYVEFYLQFWPCLSKLSTQLHLNNLVASLNFLSIEHTLRAWKQ